MNNKTRKDLKKVIEIAEDLKDIITNYIDEEQSKFDNLPEGLQQSDNGIQMEDAVMSLEEALNNFDEAIINIETAMG